MNSNKQIAAAASVAAMVAGSVMLVTSSAPPPVTGPKKAVVSWTLAESPLSNFLVSFLQSRTDARAGNWIERTNFPYRAGSNGVAVAMEWPQEFFRAGWRFAK